MPVLTKRTSDRNHSEEVGGGMSAGREPSTCESLLDIASSILNARPSCDKSAESCDVKENRPQSVGDCEIFVPMSKESLQAMKQHMETLYGQGVPFCIEVKGQRDSHSLLLEQWCLAINSKRSSSGAGIPLTFLSQAVSSFLHFSQLRSWIVAGGGTLPFRVLYRVCAPGEDGELFSSPPDLHTFPPAPLPSHHSLDVTVKSLPRHSHLPLVLRGPPTPPHPHSSLVDEKSTRTISKENAPIITPNPSCVSAVLTSASPAVNDTCTLVSASANGTRATGANGTCATVPTSASGTHATVPTSANGTHATGANGTRAPMSRSVSEVTVRRRAEQVSSHPLARTADKQEEAPSLASANHPPTCSSPVPWGREVHAKRRSCAISIKYPVRPCPPVRSNSCPAVVPSLCLLGTFEESVLNGRLKPCGHVAGFTAELGASGSFRPAHVTIPVDAAYFSLHPEHGGRGSPYLGHIDLSGVGKKGYRVPKKGTFQLTLFNPNKTVVKIYILTYDLSDMPSLTQTFVRQRTLSKHPSGGIPQLHYLMHLRFHSTKTGHIYLTKNIKLIFARRAPDTMDFDPSQVNLYTVSEGPTQPKYCPL